jgi:glycosyltransferase involved in cell wall biosynthesis
LIHRTYYSPVSKRATVPVVITVFDMIHEMFSDAFPRGDTTSTNKRVCVRSADHIICISESTASDLVRIFGVERRKISVTHLGHSPVFQDTPRVNETHQNGRPYLLYVGQRAGYKNFDAALKAYASSKLLRDEFDLVAFGGPPFNAAEVTTIDNLRLRRDSVKHRTGPDCDLALAYRGARALVYPSLYEGFGIPPLEAMSSGCAVACSGTSSLPEVVGHAALLFDPVDIDSIRSALETVGLDDSVRVELVAAGKERAGHFSWDRCAAETLTAYRKALTA